jgi:hypothetical protein
MNGITFEEPPPESTRRKGKHIKIAAELKARPGEWARVFDTASSATASQIRSGRVAAYRPVGSFEVLARKATPGAQSGVVTIWMRYVGGES